MKVFILPANHLGWGGCDGYQVLIAAKSARAAVSAGRKYGFKFYRPYTGLPPDAEDEELALAHPGELYWRPNDGTDFPWLPARDRD